MSTHDSENDPDGESAGDEPMCIPITRSAVLVWFTTSRWAFPSGRAVEGFGTLPPLIPLQSCYAAHI
jgi:hypothetical protein